MSIKRLIRKVLSPSHQQSVEETSPWHARRNKHLAEIATNPGEHRYYEMVRLHATTDNPHRHKIIPFYSLPLMIQARNIVELGCSFSYYPESYKKGSPWVVSSSPSEGVISTRILLAACRQLNRHNIKSTVTSVDIRDSANFKNAEALLKDLDLHHYWNPVMKTDSITWLKSQNEPIDFALVDSNHTYEQVSGELNNLLPLMSDKGIIVVDDCYNLDYKVNVDWCPDESEEGFERGGEYGAIHNFLVTNKEWNAEWFPIAEPSMVIISRQPGDFIP